MWTWIRKDGARVVLESTFTAVREGGKLVGVQTICRDVTERERVELGRRRRAAREELLGEVSRRFLDEAPEQAIDAALVRLGATLDAERVCLFVPDAEAQRLACEKRWSRAAVAAEAWEPLDDYPIPMGVFTRAGDSSPGTYDAADAWLAALQRDAGCRTRHALVGYGGRAFGVLSARLPEAHPWSEDDAATLRAIGELVALGRVRRATEVALAKAKEDAEAASLTKSAFLANMSHELRTPLNGVIGMVDSLAATPLDARQRRYAEVARSSARVLLSLITDILDFSRIEAGKLEIAPIAFDLRELVAEATRILALGAEEKGLTLTSEVDPRLTGGVVGDAHRLRQILVNLVSNAIKFTSRGAVRVRARLVAESTDDVRVRLEVEDTGAGIDTEGQSRLFRPFTQLDPSPARQHGGTGLGLAICRGARGAWAERSA